MQLTLPPISCKLQFDFIRNKKSETSHKMIGLELTNAYYLKFSLKRVVIEES